jgi:hypothetical protein
MAVVSFTMPGPDDPETCILRSAYKRGRVTLLIAKFIPGVNSIAPPVGGELLKSGGHRRLV